jgi:hypothetical protein
MSKLSLIALVIGWAALTPACAVESVDDTADEVAELAEDLAAPVEDEESEDGTRALVEPVEPIPANQLDCEGELEPGVAVRCTTPLGDSREFVLIDPDTFPPYTL